jgi:hypothetical protein
MLVRFVAAITVLVIGADCASATIGPSPEPSNAARTRTTTPTGVIIPLYVNPDKYWSDVIAARTAHPNVPIVLIANVDNGPGGSKYSSWATAIAKQQAAGVTVLGYVFTQYGKRSRTTVENAMVEWYDFYRVNGVFLDEMNPGDRSYYTALTSYAHAHHLPLVIGNPGENAPGNAGPDIINFWERRGYPSLSYLSQSRHVKYGKQRWSYMAGAVPFNASTIEADAPYVSYLYATNGKEPECYCKLPSYFLQLVETLSAIDAQ